MHAAKPAAAAAPTAPAAPAAPAALSQQRVHHHHHHVKKDIGDKEIEEPVHGFASNDRNVLPEPYPKQNVPYPANGSRNG